MGDRAEKYGEKEICLCPGAGSPLSSCSSTESSYCIACVGSYGTGCISMEMVHVHVMWDIPV